MNYCIIGAARSGIAAAKLAVRKGHNVFLTELSPAEKFQSAIKELETLNNCKYEFGKNSDEALKNCDCIITSPGVPPYAPIILKAIQKNIPIISELEFASSQLKNPITAITGTNGKTTTTTLINYILQNNKFKSVAAGNIGSPLSDFVDKISNDTYIVLETSSYQLEYIKTFRPNIAIILNITPDHISYHGSMENYIKAKFKITQNQTENDYLILNADDEILSEYINNTEINANKLYFSQHKVNRGIYVEDNKIIYQAQHKKEEIMQINELALPGVHNQYNSMAAGIVAKIWQVSNENLRDSLMQFKGVEHRLELVKTIGNIDYINDSKATNINAAWYALSSYNRPIIWIAGGLGDNNDYSLLDKLVKNNVSSIITIGKEEEAIFNRYSAQKPCYKAGNLNNAVNIANKIAKEGDIVLFSPACKSFDQFLNFEHRGEVFKEAVNNLIIN